MPHFTLQSAEMLATAAQMLLDLDPADIEARRHSLHLSRMAMEVALKAVLERAGYSEPELRRRRHDLAALLRDLDQCQVEIEIAPGNRQWMPGTRVRSETIQGPAGGRVTLGQILDAEQAFGTTAFPNGIRYGDPEEIRDFPPEVMPPAARALIQWAEDHWDVIRGPAGRGGAASPRTFWPASTMTTYFASEQSSEEWPCQVRISKGEILVEYRDLNAVIRQYRGRDKGHGHFEMHEASLRARATLHRLPGSSFLEGYWVEEGERGMWRITLGEG